MPSLETLLLAGRAIFLLASFAIAAWAFARYRRSAGAQEARALARHELLLARLAALEARLDDSAQRVMSHLSEALEQQGGAPPALPGYQHAIRLARNGASRDELLSACGLSLQEADLIRRLHGPHGARGTAARTQAA
jgi:hypothetical protein